MTTYLDGIRSNFKASTGYVLDEFKQMFELTSEVAQDAQEWKVLKANTQKTTAEQNRFIDLTTKLSDYFFTAEDWNYLCDCMINLEKLYKDKGLDQIESTVEDYITNEDKLNQVIDEKVGGTIDGMLLTNATQVIISSTQPAVVNGAVWFKPKTN